MNVSWLPWVSLLVSVGTLGKVISLAGWRLGRLELKVDTMWEFLMRRAQLEGIDRGFLKANSPLQVSEEMKEAFAPLMGRLREFYVQKGISLTDLELMLELERHFGDIIIREICIPHRMMNGVCLVIATKLLRGEV